MDREIKKKKRAITSKGILEAFGEDILAFARYRLALVTQSNQGGNASLEGGVGGLC